MLEMTLHRLPTFKMFSFLCFSGIWLVLIESVFFIETKRLKLTTFLTTVHAVFEFADEE